MKKFILTAVAAVALATPALAADMKVTAPAAPPNPWDIAFGGGITSVYIWRGITQSNHKPSVTAYFEPRYNVTRNADIVLQILGDVVARLEIGGDRRLVIGLGDAAPDIVRRDPPAERNIPRIRRRRRCRDLHVGRQCWRRQRDRGHCS